MTKPSSIIPKCQNFMVKYAYFINGIFWASNTNRNVCAHQFSAPSDHSTWCIPYTNNKPGILASYSRTGGGNTAASMGFKYNGEYWNNYGKKVSNPVGKLPRALIGEKRYIKSQGLRPWLSSVLSVSNVLCVLARVGWWQGSWSTNRSSEGAQIGTSTGSSIVDQSQKQSRFQLVV